MDCFANGIGIAMRPGQRRELMTSPWLSDLGASQRSGGRYSRATKHACQSIAGPTPGRSDAARFEELQQKYFGERTLPGNGAELIREARDARDAQLDGLG